MRAGLRQGALALALGLLIAHSAHAQDAPASVQAGAGTVPPQASASDMLVLEVVVDGQRVAGAIMAYQSGDEVLLPLGQLSALLTLAITTQPEQGTASGYVIEQSRTFGLDLARATVALDGRSRTFDPSLVQAHPDDIYVARALLAEWLPVDLELDLSRLSLAVHPSERLPLQLRLEREARGQAAGVEPEGGGPGYPRHDIPYRWLRAPFIDQTVSIDHHGGEGSADVQGRYTAYATADVLGLQGAFYVNADSGEQPTDVRFTLGRNDPDAGLLGPLHARTALVGSIPMPAVDHVSRSSALGNGFVVSNRRLTLPDSFGQHSLEGPLPPGWDVELYFNDILVDFQTAGPDGRYHFEDLQLLFGANEFRLVFHGPLGEVRVETETFLLEQSITRSGEFYYSVAHQRGEDGLERSLVQFDWGLTEYLAASGGLLAVPVEDETRRYANLALRAHWQSMILEGQWVHADDGGALAELLLRTRLGDWTLAAGRGWLDDFSSELYLPSTNPLRAREHLRLDGSVAVPLTSVRLPVTIEANRETRASGQRDLDIAARVAAHVRGTSMTGQLHWQSFAHENRADATLQLSRRVGGLGIRSQVNYALAPDPRVTAVAIAADRRVGEGYLQSFGITRLFDSSETLYTVGLTKSLGSFGFGVNASYSSLGEITAGLQLFVAMGREPRSGDWYFDAVPMAATGAASALAFLDDNLNGRRDPGERPIEGVAFAVNGGRSPVTTNADGIAYLERLPAQQHTGVELLTASLEDPQLRPRIGGVQVVPRPGAVAELDFPVISTSEVEGMISVEGTRVSPAGLTVEMIDAAGEVVASGVSAADGYYVVLGVPPGEYTVRIAPAQLERADLVDLAALRTVTVRHDDWLVSGMDIRLLAGWR